MNGFGAVGSVTVGVVAHTHRVDGLIQAEPVVFRALLLRERWLGFRRRRDRMAGNVHGCIRSSATACAGSPEVRGSKIIRVRLAAAAAVVGLSFLVTPAVAHAEASSRSDSWFGCPSGAVCIFNGPDKESGVDLAFWSYGPHNLSNVFGNRLWFNNQYGSPHPWAYLCKGYNGTGGQISAVGSGGGVDDFGPVNSVIVGRPGGYPGDGCKG